MNNQPPDSKQPGPIPPPPGPKHGEVPPHILQELFRLQEKVGRLEGMLEVLLRQKDNK